MSIHVELDRAEFVGAATVGITRQINALLDHRPDRHGCHEEDGWRVHIEGACSERAMAKATGRYWNSPIDTYKTGGDVGRFQVRCRSKKYYDLIVREDDRDEDIFVLVVGAAPIYDVIGFIKGSDAKQPQWRKNYDGRGEAWFVPQDALVDIDLLRKK